MSAGLRLALSLLVDRRSLMQAVYGLVAVISAALFIYLLTALVRAEDF